MGGDDFYIDLLFYNLNLRCYVVIELKTGEFKPEYAGQLNFYLSAVDGIFEKKELTILPLVCFSAKSKTTWWQSIPERYEQSQSVSANTKITNTLPKELEQQLPSVEDLQNEFKNRHSPLHCSCKGDF